MLEQSRKNVAVLTAVVGLAVAAGVAQAQQKSHEDAPQARRDRPILSGPQVREQRMPGVESGFSAGAQEGRRGAAAFVPPQVFRKVLAELMAEDAPVAIRLSAEQRERIIGHARAFERETGRKLDRAGGRDRDALPGGERRSARPDAMEGDRRRPTPPARNADRQPRPEQPSRRGPGMADNPQPDQSDRSERARPDRQADQRRGVMRAVAQLQNRVWAELSAAQQAHVSEAIEAWRATRSEQQLDHMRDRYRREIGARFDQMEADRPTAAGASDLRAWLAGLPADAQQRARQRLAAMPEERRRALLERLATMSPEALERLRQRLINAPEQDSPARPPR